MTESSVLGRPLTVTVFPDLHGRKLQRHTRTLRDLARPIYERTAPAKANLPLLKLSTFGDTATVKGSFRHDDNVTAIDGIEADYDGEKLSFNDAAAKLRAANVAALLYTSPSHRPEAPRWRVLCPCSRRLLPSDRTALVDRLNGVLDATLAGESWALSQAFYFGRLTNAPDHRVQIIDGCAIDLATEIVGIPRLRAAPGPSQRAEPNAERLGLSIEEAQKILSKLPFEKFCDQRDGWLTVAMALKHEFGDDGFALWDEFSQASGKYDPEDQARVWDSLRGGGSSPVRMATLKAATRAVDIAEMFEELGDGEPAAQSGDFLDDLLGPKTQQNTRVQGDSQSADALAVALEKPALEWTSRLDLTEEGGIRPSLHNVTLIIRHDPRTRGLMALNEFTQEVVQRGQPGTFRQKKDSPKGTKQLTGPIWHVTDPINGDLWTDSKDDAVRDVIEAPSRQGGYGIRISDRDLDSAINIVGRENAFHPVREYLERNTWDGTPRVEHMFFKYFGAPNDAYTRSVARLMLIAGVTRVYEPGHKFDFAVILRGFQGKRKSTFISILAHKWFAELKGDFHDTRMMVEMMQGSWILEIPELSQFARGDVRLIKGFISCTTDKARLAYARRAQAFPRQCIFIGSTNDSEFLRDETGGRRFWMIECLVDEVDTDAFAAEVDQIWAEALVLYREMRRHQPHGTLPLYLTDDAARKEAERLQESHRIETPDDMLAGEIAAWLDKPVVDETGFDDLEDLLGPSPAGTRNETCLIQLWVECLAKDRASYIQSTAASQALGRAMKRLPEWTNVGPRSTKYGRQRVYRRAGYDPLDAGPTGL